MTDQTVAKIKMTVFFSVGSVFSVFVVKYIPSMGVFFHANKEDIRPVLH